MHNNKPVCVSHAKKKLFFGCFLLSVILFSAGLTGCQSVQNNESGYSKAREFSVDAKSHDVYVESEFAPLKKVIVSQSEFTDQILPLEQVYMPLDEIESFGGEVVGDNVVFHFDADRIAKMEAERAALTAILEKYGVEVVMPRKLTDKERELAADPMGPTHGKGLTNEFVRDPFVVVGDHVIESNFRKEYRRFEALTGRELFPKNCDYVAMPVADLTDEEKGPFLEGGDVIVYNKQVFVGNSGYGSNSAGIEWLRGHLAPYGYEVTEVRLQGNILHLDCAMSLVREGLMIVCEESFADGIPEPFKDWELIKVPEKDAIHLAVNGMAINPDVYITDIEFKDSIGKELEDKGITVEYIDFSATRVEAGSIHCSTQPLLRVNE